MPPYDASRFDPPAPLAQVTLRNLATGKSWSDVPMLLDSGADVTLLPHSVLDQLDLTVLADKQYELADLMAKCESPQPCGWNWC